MPPEAEICRKKAKVCKDRISALPDDLLLEILSQIPIEDAVTTMILSKRWRSVWTMIPKLDYTETDKSDESLWDFLDKSMQLHRAPSLKSLSIDLGNECPVDADVGKWVTHAVERCNIRDLELRLSRHQIVPACLCTCKTLVKLILYYCNIDVPSIPCLPSLESLKLISVLYKDEDSHVRLLSGCPVLRDLYVFRSKEDNVTRFSVKVPSLEKLKYVNWLHGSGRSLVIDSPELNHAEIVAPLEGYYSIQDMPRLDVAVVNVKVKKISHLNGDKLMRSFSTVTFLQFPLTELACCSAISFSRLIKLKLCPIFSRHVWLKPLITLLHNAPKLKVLKIGYEFLYDDLPLSWNEPSSVPRCLLSHLEIFEWDAYRGRIKDKKFVAYILANSKCLKMARICRRSYYNNLEEKKMMEELESMDRVSASAQLLFSNKQILF